MKILVVGGGSGGHVTPVVAVVSELQRRSSSVNIRFWCDRAYYKQASELMAVQDDSIKVSAIFSGKFRRYHSLPVWRQLLMIRTIGLPNLIDLIKIIIGTFQSFIKLIMWRPDVVFTKGGFVCLPVGLSAYVLRIPLVIHDSDAHPGLTNRILARMANTIATGAPLENYSYPKDRTHYVGIPLVADLKPLGEAEQRVAKRKLGFNELKPLVLVTGGGLGALRLNNAVSAVLPQLLERDISVLLVSGQKQFSELADTLKDYTSHESFQLKGHISSGFQAVLAAADVVVSRAGATTLLELAALAKPTIVVPNARLTGGHQLKNAAAYSKYGAIEVVSDDDIESNPDLLTNAIFNLLEDDLRRRAMSRAIQQMAKPHAARDMADLITNTAKK